jgi:hypothetical protein
VKQVQRAKPPGRASSHGSFEWAEPSPAFTFPSCPLLRRVPATVATEARHLLPIYRKLHIYDNCSLVDFVPSLLFPSLVVNLLEALSVSQASTLYPLLRSYPSLCQLRVIQQGFPS